MGTAKLGGSVGIAWGGVHMQFAVEQRTVERHKVAQKKETIMRQLLTILTVGVSCSVTTAILMGQQGRAIGASESGAS
jgi:hypothetical protein